MNSLPSSNVTRASGPFLKFPPWHDPPPCHPPAKASSSHLRTLPNSRHSTLASACRFSHSIVPAMEATHRHFPRPRTGLVACPMAPYLAHPAPPAATQATDLRNSGIMNSLKAFPTTLSHSVSLIASFGLSEFDLSELVSSISIHDLLNFLLGRGPAMVPALCLIPDGMPNRAVQSRPIPTLRPLMPFRSTPFHG